MSRSSSLVYRNRYFQFNFLFIQIIRKRILFQWHIKRDSCARVFQFTSMDHLLRTRNQSILLLCYLNARKIVQSLSCTCYDHGSHFISHSMFSTKGEPTALPKGISHCNQIAYSHVICRRVFMKRRS